LTGGAEVLNYPRRMLALRDDARAAGETGTHWNPI
jgi:hypothetical protein